MGLLGILGTLLLDNRPRRPRSIRSLIWLIRSVGRSGRFIIARGAFSRSALEKGGEVMIGE